MSAVQVANAPLDFATLREQSTSRCARWHGPGWRSPDDPWSLADWANVVGLASIEARAALQDKLANELADVVLYADLLAAKAGICLETAIREKFNRVSVAQGFPERL